MPIGYLYIFHWIISWLNIIPVWWLFGNMLYALVVAWTILIPRGINLGDIVQTAKHFTSISTTTTHSRVASSHLGTVPHYLNSAFTRHHSTRICSLLFKSFSLCLFDLCSNVLVCFILLCSFVYAYQPFLQSTEVLYFFKSLVL